MKTYAEKLKDPRWQKKRLEVMERDQFMCRKCRARDKTLNVHHLAYKKGKNPWEYEDDLLLTVCEDCHAQIEDFDCKIAFSTFMATRGLSLDTARRLLNNLMIAGSVCEDCPSEISMDMMRLSVSEAAMNTMRPSGPLPTDGLILGTKRCLQ